MCAMFAFAPAALLFTWLCISVRRDRRRFGNAVLSGLTLIFLSVGLLSTVKYLPDGLALVIGLLALLVPSLGVVALAGFLVANGLTMIRKEGRRPANLLSGLLGLAIFGMIALLLRAVTLSGTKPSDLAYLNFVIGASLVAAYLSFLFLCFLVYTFLYGRIAVRGDVDFVVILGSGLIGGERVAPLLASRLRKGQEIHSAQIAGGGRAPVLLTSGGQGPDEKLPEAAAMANWLVENGTPADHVWQEDRSRTTDENLNFSREIMAGAKEDYTCVVVTNNFHAFRAAMTARKAGVNGQVLGSPTARYFWPSATIREFVAVFWDHKVVNLSICGALIALTVLQARR